MKYKLKEHVTDEMLEEIGFIKCSENTFGKTYEKDINIYDENALYVDKQTNTLRVSGYEFGLENYIQDLIELGYVEVVE